MKRLYCKKIKSHRKSVGLSLIAGSTRDRNHDVLPAESPGACYPAIRSIGWDAMFIMLAFFHSLCTVTDFSSGGLPIGVKFCIAVRLHRSSAIFFGGGGTQGWQLWASTEAVWRDMLLAEALVFFLSVQCNAWHWTDVKIT